MNSLLSYTIFTDGASRGNPGPCGAGVIIRNPEDKVIVEMSKFLGNGTNNFAEYTSLLLALQKAQKLNIQHLNIFMDSKLVVEQVNGRWAVRKEELKKIHSEIQKLKENFITFELHYVRRAYNKDADKLANKAFD